MRRGATRTRILGGAAVVALTLVGACGLPADDGPQAIPREDLPPDLLDLNPGSSTTLPESPATTTVDVYLLEEAADGVHLVTADREVTDAEVPNERLTTLFLGPSPAEIDEGLTSAIPTDTMLLDVITDEEANEVIVDVSEDLFTIDGELLAQAFAQIVWTATEPDAGGYRFVRLFVDGEPTTVLDGEGAEKDGAVTRADYTTLSPR